jgi:hypothetical protein
MTSKSEFIKTTLESYFTFRAGHINTISDFKNDLEANNEYDLVVLESKSQEEIQEFYNEHNSKIPTLILTEEFVNSDIDDFVSLENTKVVIATLSQVERIVHFVSKVLNVNFKESKSKSQSKFIQIGTNLINEYTKIPFDTFIRISSGHKQYKYIKIINADSEVKDSLLEKHKEESLYIQKKDYTYILTDFVEKSGHKRSIEDELLETSFLVDIIPYFIYEYGQEESKIQSATNKIVENCVTLCSKVGETQGIFEDMFKNKLSLRFQNCFLKILFAYQIFERRRELTKANLEKIILTSLFSDISLDDEVLLSITTEESPLFFELSDDDKERVSNHAYHSFEDSKKILKKSTQHKVGESILHHSGSKDGKGFFFDSLKDYNEFDKTIIIISFYVSTYLKDGEPLTTKTAFSYLKKQFANENLEEYQCLI